MRSFAEAARAASTVRVRRSSAEGRRATIAAIFRATPAGEGLLFIRRAINERDPWSGHVALPGGRQEPSDNGDDEATAMREALEEVGVKLSDGAVWERLGRLCDDRVTHTSGRPLVVSMFGFVSRPDATIPPLALQPSEVADAWWVDSSVLSTENLAWRSLPITLWLPGLKRRPTAAALFHWLGVGRVYFAAIQLPLPPATRADADADADAARRAAAPDDEQAYQLWGLTLLFLSDAVRDTGFRSTPLVGEGAPPDFRETFRAEGGMLASASLQAIFLLGKHRRTLGKVLKGAGAAAGLAAAGLVVAAVVGGSRGLRR